MNSPLPETLPTRRIWAHHNDHGVVVYQAFRPETVRAAVARGTFGPGFTFDRLTWIKPSFGWMLHRSAYATRHRQEAIARIWLSHTGFQTILAQSTQTLYDPAVFATERDWSLVLGRGEVRHQWDPDRDLRGVKLARRAIQIGLRGETVHRYVNEWILGVEEVTELAHEIGRAAQKRAKPLPAVPDETEYPLPPDLLFRLGCDSLPTSAC